MVQTFREWFVAFPTATPRGRERFIRQLDAAVDRLNSSLQYYCTNGFSADRISPFRPEPITWVNNPTIQGLELFFNRGTSGPMDTQHSLGLRVTFEPAVHTTDTAKTVRDKDLEAQLAGNKSVYEQRLADKNRRIAELEKQLAEQTKDSKCADTDIRYLMDRIINLEKQFNTLCKSS